MANTIGSRPNHYDALGLSPTASEDEIAKAFGKAVGLFGAHSAAGAARLAIAFETLRDPEARRAYDESIGLKSEPAATPPLMAVSFRMTARPVAPEPHVDPAPGRGPSSFIASSLREIARPVDLDPSPRAAVQPQPQTAPAEPVLSAPAEADDGIGTDDRPIDWRRPAVAVGAVLLAAGLVGALAGVSVKGAEQSQAGVTTALPAAKSRPQITAAESPMPIETAAGPAERLARAQPAEARPKRIAPEPAASLDVPPADGAAVQPASDQAEADPLAPQADTSIATVAADGLPLASKLVARTIEHIGYACGDIASTSAVDGAAGVYKVTCTSGQSYRAAPVHGRYRFKRW